MNPVLLYHERQLIFHYKGRIVLKSLAGKESFRIMRPL